MQTAFVFANGKIGQDEKDEKKLLERIRKTQGVQEAYRVYGVYDIVVKAQAETMPLLKQVVERIRQCEGVRTSLVMIVVADQP